MGRSQDAVKHSAVHRADPPPPMQMYPVQNVSGAEVEKSIESISRSVMTDSVRPHGL